MAFACVCQSTHTTTIQQFASSAGQEHQLKGCSLNKESQKKKKNKDITYQNILIFMTAVLKSEMIDSPEA